MTIHRDADRTLQAWLDLMPDEAPDRALAAIDDAVRTSPQRKAGRIVRALPNSSLGRDVRRAWWVLAAALLVAAALAVGVLAGGGFRDRRLGEVVRPASPLPAAAGVLPGDWVADVAPIPNLGAHDPRIRLSFEAGAAGISLHTGTSGVQVMHGRVEAMPDGNLTVRSDQGGLGCHEGDIGHYRWSQGTDAGTVTLALLDDACVTRGQTLPRSWWRALDWSSNGGQGVISTLDPAVLLTLPDGQFTGHTYLDAIEIGNDATASTLYAIKDPWGWSDPCSATGGTARPIAPNRGAYLDYLRGLPGFSVTTQELTIGGRPAVHATVKTDAAIDCPGGVIIEWIAGADAPGGVTWHLTPGDPDSLYLVEAPGHVFLFQYLGPGLSTADELRVMETIGFQESLASAPSTPP